MQIIKKNSILRFFSFLIKKTLILVIVYSTQKGDKQMTNMQFLTEQEIKEYDGDILSLDELITQYPDSYNKVLELFRKDYGIDDEVKSVLEFRKVFCKSLFTVDGKLYEHHK